jgi:hypothetical protein
MNYHETDIEIKLGDLVLYAGAKAIVMELRVPARPENIMDPMEGILIRFGNGALAELENADEDLEYVERSAIP